MKISNHMKRLFTLLVAFVVATASVLAQEAELRKAAQCYQNVRSLTAHVTMTRHLASLSSDLTAEGSFYFKRPDTEALVFDQEKEMLLSSGSKFVMVREGHQRTAKPHSGNPFEAVKEVFAHLIAGSVQEPLSTSADVTVTRQGHACTLTITPKSVSNGKKSRRLPYSSCVAIIDLETAELRQLTIHERAGNFTRFAFSSYRLNAKVDDKVFSTARFL